MICKCYRESIGFFVDMSDFIIEKDKNNQYRWFTISSSGYLDRDNEFVTVKALEKAVDRMWAKKEFGELRWGHGNIVLGYADWADVQHHQLIESGTFIDDEIAEKVLKNANNLKVSIGFSYNPFTRKDNEYHDITMKERSLLLKGKESNPFTNLTVVGGKMAGNHMEDLVAIVGEEKALSLLSDAANRAKEADESGHVRKEATKKGWWQQVKEAFSAIPDPEEDEEDEEETEDELEVESMEDKDKPTKKEATPNEDNQPRLTLEQVESLIAKEFQAFRDEQETLRTKATSELATKSEVAEVVGKQETTTKALSVVSEQLKELRGEQPRVFGQFGYRASQAEETKTGEKAKKPEAKSGISAIREQLESQVTGG